MKHYILLDIINKCNKACDYCVMAKWRNNPDYPDTLTWEQITHIMGDYREEGDEVYVEITGGEPTLYPDLLIVLDMLEMVGAKVLLRTNGINLYEWRLKYPNMMVILAKHDSSDKYIEERKPYLMQHDVIQIGAGLGEIQDPEARSFTYVRREDNKDLQHRFDTFLFVTNGSVLKSCPGDRFDIEYPWEAGRGAAITEPCGTCPYCNTAWEIFSTFTNMEAVKWVG